MTAADNKKSTNQRGKKKPLLRVLDVLIVIVALIGVALIVQPYITHWQQDRHTRELLDRFEDGDGIISFEPDELVVAGEDIEYFNDFGGYETDLTETTATVQPSETATQPDESIQTEPATETSTSETTAGPAVSPKPERVVVKAIGRIEIPRIDLSMPIAEGASNYNLRVAIGHYTPSAALGEAGRSVLFGHRMYTYGRHFNRLGEIETGDTIIIEDKTRRYTYTVNQIDRVLPQELLGRIYAPVDGSHIMLVTCDPVRVASHRLLVQGTLTSTEPL